MYIYIQLYENSVLNTSNPLNYIFKIKKCPPQHKDQLQYESDLLELIKSVKFKKGKNKFLDQLHKKVKNKILDQLLHKACHLLRNLKMFPFVQTKLGTFMEQTKTPTVNC